MFIKKMLLLVCCSLSILHAFGQNLYDLENSERYANYLFKTNRFSLSAKEYQRLVFMKPADTTIQLTMLKSYRNAAEYENGLAAAHRLYPSTDTMPGLIANEYALLLVNTNQFEGLNAMAINNRYLTQTDKERMLLNYYTLTQQWSEAEQFLQREGARQLSNSAEYGALIARGKAFKESKPGVALALSAVVPGLGKVYTHDWTDGLISFVIIGTNAFQSYRGFSKNGLASRPGWIFASIGTGFYIGNLYGSHKAARQYNIRFKKRMQHEASRMVLGAGM